MQSRTQALLRLLEDDDPGTVELVKAELLRDGNASVPILRELLSSDNHTATTRVRELLHTIEQRNAAATFSRLCENGHIHLEEACMSLAKALDAGCDVLAAEQSLDAWAQEFRGFLAKDGSPREAVEMLTQYLGGDIGMSGNAEDYYNPQNSLLPRVIERRLGIPITLAVVYMLVGARAGIIVDGINLPGHFLARHQDIFFDPFHQGRILTMMDCREILVRQNIEIKDAYFEAASARQILMRVLANLLNIASSSGTPQSVDQLATWLDQLGAVERG